MYIYIKLNNIVKNIVLLTIVRSPDTRELTKSLPALAQTIVLCAPDTAGPWSAVNIKDISRNLQYIGGRHR